MDKIGKFLKRLTKKDRQIINRVIESVLVGDVSGFDVKKLKGCSGLFRVRIGDFRLIFYKDEKMIRIILLDRRDKDTYK